MRIQTLIYAVFCASMVACSGGDNNAAESEEKGTSASGAAANRTTTDDLVYPSRVQQEFTEPNVPAIVRDCANTNCFLDAVKVTTDQGGKKIYSLRPCFGLIRPAGSVANTNANQAAQTPRPITRFLSHDCAWQNADIPNLPKENPITK